jgi:hypothetical protein
MRNARSRGQRLPQLPVCFLQVWKFGVFMLCLAYNRPMIPTCSGPRRRAVRGARGGGGLRSVSGRAGLAVLACAVLGVCGLPWPGPAGVVRAGDAAEPAPLWKRIAEEDGVVVDEQPIPGMRVPRLRAVVEVPSALYDVLPVILDATRHTEWMPGCMESRPVRIDGIARTMYNRTDTPWPFSDRDVVLRSRVVVLEPGARIEMPFESVEDAAAPPLSDAVRMPLLRGHYRIEAAAPDRTRVELQIELDPGGLLPAWMIRFGAEKSSVLTLVGLRRQVAATRGRYAEFVADFLAHENYERR